MSWFSKSFLVYVQQRRLADLPWWHLFGYSEQTLSTLHPFPWQESLLQSRRNDMFVILIGDFLPIGSPSMANLPLKWQPVGLAGQALTNAWRCRVVIFDGDAQSFAQPRSKTGEITDDFCLKRYHLVSQPRGPGGVSSLCRCSVVVIPRYSVAHSPFLAAITQRRLAIQSQTYLLEIAPLGRLMSATLRRV